MPVVARHREHHIRHGDDVSDPRMDIHAPDPRPRSTRENMEGDRDGDRRRAATYRRRQEVHAVHRGVHLGDVQASPFAASGRVQAGQRGD